jgi:phosphoribosylformimino-5-aminoimidazole carboxamide ribotide isomerase
VIVTSFLFEGGEFSMARLERLAKVVPPHELVIDLSCRKTATGYFVATNRWQTVTSAKVEAKLLESLAPFCSEFLVHAADVEGLCRGVEEDLVQLLGDASPLSCTYAGGARDLEDLASVERLSGGRVDLTYGSALDIFGGSGVKYRDLVAHNRKKGKTTV